MTDNKPDTSGAVASEGRQDDLDAQLLAWAVSNCHTLARRALAHTTSGYDREKWEHVLRICEKAGARSAGVLRASLPTEITDGSDSKLPEPPAASEADTTCDNDVGRRCSALWPASRTSWCEGCLAQLVAPPAASEARQDVQWSTPPFPYHPPCLASMTDRTERLQVARI